MGKKDKKKKGLGKAKTEAKAAKKSEKANKKARAAAGDEDVDAILAEILAKEAAAVAVAEISDCAPPSPRASFSIVASPIRTSDLIFFGGERFTGDRAAFFSDLYLFNVDKRIWTRYDSPNRPPPRSSHAVALHKNMMYLFGGEFSNPSLSQYRHYRDLWRLDLEDMSWEKIELRGGPCARSGHRMIIAGGKLLVFGGFVDTGVDIKYLNDLYTIDLTADTLKWTKVETSATDVVPSPRSGFQWVAYENDVLLYGGYCRELAPKAKNISHKGKKKGGSAAAEEALVSKGVVLSDMFKLSLDTLKWQKLKHSGYGPSRRAGFSMVLHKKNAVVFGGVEDDETEDDLKSVFYSDMFALNIERRKWFPMTLRKRKDRKGGSRRRRKDVGSASTTPTAEDKMEDVDEVSVQESAQEVDENEEVDTEALEAELNLQKEEENTPCGRFNACVCVQNNVLYIAGGSVEKKEKELTLDDIWSIDLNKLDEFQLVKGLSAECSEWIESESEDSDDEEEEDLRMGEEDEEGMEDDEEEEDGKQSRLSRRERLRNRMQHTDGSNLTPLVNEALKDFFERTRNYWVGEVHEALGLGGKELRRVAFEWAYKRYWEIKPTLRELEELEAELAREEQLEKEFAKAQADIRRVRNRR